MGVIVAIFIYLSVDLKVEGLSPFVKEMLSLFAFLAVASYLKKIAKRS
jgi:hypothetical protein